MRERREGGVRLEGGGGVRREGGGGVRREGVSGFWSMGTVKK